MPPPSYIRNLQCTRCGRSHDVDRPQRFCDCGGPLYARYDLESVALIWRDTQIFRDRASNLWRFAEMLPVKDPAHRISLGEGGTPLLRLARLGRELGLAQLFAKDEGTNPTGSFKARGLAVAVSRARELGLRTLSIPTAGNAGSALAAYCARAGLDAVIYMPEDTPAAFVKECRTLGARVVQIPGTIADAGAAMASVADREGWFPISTLQEPYRLEGKKTMGYELVEDLGWKVPDVILYPTGGGTGLLGMWKAFGELEALDLIGSQRPRMIVVQASGCAPVVRSLQRNDETIAPWNNAQTVANGLRVPRPFADREILGVVRESDGTAVSVDDRDMIAMIAQLGRSEGIYAAPEAAATLVAARCLVGSGAIQHDDTVVAFLTGNAYKYQESL